MEAFFCRSISRNAGSHYDNLTGKYCYDTFVAEPYELTVPDPSGKVTVFSNMVFQGTGWNPKSKTILHPDGTSQSILHVKGQASGDSYSGYLVVTIYNSKYPSGYQVDYTVVAFSFDKSYDVTNIIAEREVNNVSIVVTTYVGKWDVQSYFWVSTVGTDVYIVMIPDVPIWIVSDMEAVRRGVEEACMVMPLVHLDTWKGLTYLEVVDMPTYEYIIQYPENVKPPGFHGETGIIVVNAHGEVLPVQPGCYWETWVRVIRQHVQRKALTWVQVAGYPFYYYSYGLHVKTEVGPQGFQLFLEMILGPNTVDCWPNQEGYAVPIQGGYSNRLWGYGLIGGGLHKGRPLKIDSSTNIADLLDVMGYRSGDIEYLTLGLIGFAFPNQTVQKPSERVGYYVHNGAQYSDNDFNKGKYSMAVAAWTKISILAVGYSDVYYQDYWGNKYYVGSFTSTVTWSYAIPPPSSTAPWTIRFVTTTIACMIYYGPFFSLPFGLWAPLKVTRTSSTTTFEFISSQSTTLEDSSEQSWQNTIAQGFLWTAISVILVPVTLGWSVSAQVGIAVALGFASTVTAVAYQSPSPITSGDYIDLALEDYSGVGVVDAEGNAYLQLQSYAVTETYLAQSANGGASETLTFTSGQKAWYVNPDLEEFYAEKTLSFPVPTIVEPCTSADVNHPSETPSTPSGPTSGYRNVWYTYYTSTTDPDGDDVRYHFEFTGSSLNVSFATGWYASGQTGSITVMWETTDPLGTYQVRVRAQDVYEEWSYWSPYLTVNIVNRPPNTPSLTGPTSGYVGGSYTYKACATDPDGDSVKYTFYWSDGSTTTGYYGSGVEVSRSHSWSSTGSYSVKVKATDVYGAYKYSSSLTVTIYSGGGGCPILFVWNGAEYVCEGLLDIHNPEGVDVIYEHTLVTTPQRENGVYSLRLTEHPQTHSYIDEVKLYAILEEGTMIQLPLIYAWHSEDGNVLPQLLFSDDWKTDTLGADHNNGTSQSIDLKFAALSPNLEVTGFMFQIEGNNRISKV